MAERKRSGHVHLSNKEINAISQRYGVQCLQFALSLLPTKDMAQAEFSPSMSITQDNPRSESFDNMEVNFDDNEHSHPDFSSKARDVMSPPSPKKKQKSNTSDAFLTNSANASLPRFSISPNLNSDRISKAKSRKPKKQKGKAADQAKAGAKKTSKSRYRNSIATSSPFMFLDTLYPLFHLQKGRASLLQSLLLPPRPIMQITTGILKIIRSVVFVRCILRIRSTCLKLPGLAILIYIQKRMISWRLTWKKMS